MTTPPSPERETPRALPEIVNALRADGYEIDPDKVRAYVPPIAPAPPPVETP